MVESSKQQNNTEVDSWHKSVPIKEELKKGCPFPALPSKAVTGTILAYVGWKYTVCQILQKVSNSTRAYIVSQGGLKGFLVEFKLVDWIKELKAKGGSELEETTGVHDDDYAKLVSTLS